MDRFATNLAQLWGGVTDVIIRDKFWVIGQGVWILWGSKVTICHCESQSSFPAADYISAILTLIVTEILFIK